MDHHAQENNGDSAGVLHDRSKDDGANGIDNTEADHNVPDLTDAQSTGYVGLERVVIWYYKKCPILCIVCPADLGEVSTDEGLLHADEDGERDEQLLVGLLQLVGRGRQQFDSGDGLSRH